MQPLADSLRPTSLDEIIGQQHLIGKDKPIRKMVESDQLSSMVFWGPPGVGKTTLARAISHELDRNWHELSAVSAGKSDIRTIIQEAENNQKGLLEAYQAPVLFIDEIHRFNKAQQDYLLPFVENGTIILIGATTENPSFEVISALLSRVRVFILQSLSDTEIEEVIKRATSALKSGKIDAKTKEWLINFASGDARKLIGLLENTFVLYEKISVETLKQTLQSNHLAYDKKGEEHYNTISAFIKSMRASNPDAALYYLARMVEAGEDPLFIARRMVIFASEDIGLAQPTALVVANAVFEAVQKIGYPECTINLAHGVSYLAQAKKDRRAYDGLRSAQADIKKFGNLAIPLHLRNAPTQLMKTAGYGKNYEMYPDPDKNLLPDKLAKKKYLVDN